MKWTNAPAGTKGFALTVYDPDAPTGSGWCHWLIFNIPANVASTDFRSFSRRFGSAKRVRGAGAPV